MNPFKKLRQVIGCCLIDVPRFLRRVGVFCRAKDNWVWASNRNDVFELAPGGARGLRCSWQYTRDLHICKVLSWSSRLLMKRALQAWGVELKSQPKHVSNAKICCNSKSDDHVSAVQISFIIGHRGKERLPHLLQTLRSIAAQVDVSFECIVVEQSDENEIESTLPEWVIYAHEFKNEDEPYNRSSAFNFGADIARGDALVLHDNDLLIPKAYAKEGWGRIQAGYDFVNLKRFIFYFTEDHSPDQIANATELAPCVCESVMQNAEGGGSIVALKNAFFGIGRMDASFVGWGGEDNEFWERALTRKAWLWAYMPLFHLWHPMQEGKKQSNPQNVKQYKNYSKVPPSERILKLKNL